MDPDKQFPSTSSASSSALKRANIENNDDSDNEEMGKNDTVEDPKSVNSLRAMLESVLEENRILKATVEEQKISLAKANQALDTKMSAEAALLLKKCMKVRRSHLMAEIRKRKGMKKELAMLLKEEEELKSTEQVLSLDLKRANVRNASKSVQVQNLKRKLNRLKIREVEKQDNVLADAHRSILEEVGGGTQEAILIFPEEIWMMVFGKLSDWKDLLNCSKACLLFHRKLHPLKVTFLFDQVFPYLFEHLPGAEILKCRSVCKEWNLGIDGYLEHHPSIRPQNESSRNSLHLPFFLNPMFEKRLGGVYIFSFRMPGYLRTPNCLDGAMLTSRNPFIGRSCHIELPVGFDWRIEGQDELEQWEGQMKDEEYWAGLYTFLENHGKHINYLTLEFSGDTENPGDFTPQKMNTFLTGDLFRLLPNLKSISFDQGLHDFPMGEVRSLPSAPNLETIEFNELFGVGEISSHPLRVALLKKFRPQLQKLYLQSESCGREMSQMEWPKLTELHVGGIYKTTCLGNILRHKMPQLRTLVVMGLGWKCRQWSNPFEHDEATMDRLLDTVAKLSTTTPLDTLRIYGEIREELNSLGDDMFLKALQTEVPKLPMPAPIRTLELQFSQNTCHSFLLRFPYLENLKLFWRGRGRDISTYDCFQPVKELVEVNKYVMGGEVGRRRGIYKSNIWKLMPRLKLLSYRRETYTRNEYDQYMRRQYERQMEGFAAENPTTTIVLAVTETKIEAQSNI